MNSKSLTKSLEPIYCLLTKHLGFAHIQIILPYHKQSFSYPNHQTELIKLDNHEYLLPQTSYDQICTSIDHPFNGLPSEIKFYASKTLRSSAKTTLGFLFLLDTKERSLSIEELSSLEEFSKLITNTIEKHQTSTRSQQVFTDFMHKAIHDLKNPLTSISLTSELLKRKADDPKMVVNFCEKLEKVNQRLFSNLEKLKSSFPVEDNNFKLSINEISVTELLDEIKISIPISYLNQVEKNIYADRNRLKEAIMLLIGESYSNGDKETYIKAYQKEQEVAIEIPIQEEEETEKDSLPFIIAKTLIGMHGGNLEVNKESYVIYLPSNN